MHFLLPTFCVLNNDNCLAEVYYITCRKFVSLFYCSQVTSRTNAKGSHEIVTIVFFNDKTISFQVYAVMDFEDFDRMFSAYQKKEVLKVIPLK